MHIIKRTMKMVVATLLFGTIVFASYSQQKVGTLRRPNVLVIMADQWRTQAIAHHGDPNVQTPYLDALAREGIDFVNAFAEIPVCTPSRASFMTGQYPLRNGVFMNDVQLDTNALSIAEVFRESGYATACIGKWHIDGMARSAFIPAGGRRQGFDYWKVFECTHDYNHSLYYANSPDTLLWEGYDVFAQTEDAIRYMEGRRGDEQQFFLLLSWGPPHDPYHTASDKYRQLYNPQDIRLRPNVPEPRQSQAQHWHAGYYAHCIALDSQIGKLTDYLLRSGLDSNTVLLFLSDHGDLLGSHGQTNKQQPYDESIRVPMVFRLPDSYGIRNVVCDAPMGISDVMPTLLGLCGIGIPSVVNGRDYTPYMLGRMASPPDTAKLITCIQPFGQWSRNRGGREFRGIRTTRYAYVRDLNGPWLFFDNLTDPYQQHNLLKNLHYQKLVNSLDRLLKARLHANGDEFLPGLEYVRRYNYPPLDETENTIRVVMPIVNLFDTKTYV